jgi:hypothetical protein
MSLCQIKGLRLEVRGFRQIIQNLRVGEALASDILLRSDQCDLLVSVTDTDTNH